MRILEGFVIILAVWLLAFTIFYIFHYVDRFLKEMEQHFQVGD